MAGSLRPSVLAMYKRLLRLSQTWQAKVPSETQVERNYIAEETRRLFKTNKNLQISENEVAERLREAEARLTMAEHYRNPYPRPVNMPQGTYTRREGKKVGKAIDRQTKLSKPIYIKSIDDTMTGTNDSANK